MTEARPSHAGFGIAAIVVLGVGTGAGGWLEPRRPAPPDERPAAPGEAVVFEVTSGADAGPGSLREALFAAAAIDGPVRVVVRARVELASPLPPLAHAGELTVEGGVFSQIDARGLAAAPVLEVRSPGAVLRDLRIRRGAQGVVVSAGDVELRRLTVAECDVGVRAGPGAAGLVVADGFFEANRVGIELAADPRRVRLAGNRFKDHREAAVWAVAPAPVPGLEAGDLVIRDNSFARDQIGVVLAEVAATVEDNDFVAARTAAVYLSGAGAVVRANRVRDGEVFGIQAIETRGAVIAANELAGNRAVAIMERSGRGSRLEDNRLRANGYGIATAFSDAGAPVVVAGNVLERQLYDALTVIGGAPVIRGNRALRNRGAGLRVLDYLPVRGPRVAATPRLGDNVLEDNVLGARLDGEYRERP